MCGLTKVAHTSAPYHGVIIMFTVPPSLSLSGGAPLQVRNRTESEPGPSSPNSRISRQPRCYSGPTGAPTRTATAPICTHKHTKPQHRFASQTTCDVASQPCVRVGGWGAGGGRGHIKTPAATCVQTTGAWKSKRWSRGCRTTRTRNKQRQLGLP